MLSVFKATIKNCYWCIFTIKPCTDVASNLLVIGLQLDVRIASDGLQQKSQHAEYFTCNP